MIGRNHLKEAIAAGRRVRGVHFTCPVPGAMEVLAASGFDYIYIDGEHGVFGPADIEACCIIAERHGVTPIARVPANTVPVITHFLDRGVKGIIIPHVESEEQARRAVDASYYAPLGQRSFGGGRPYAHVGCKDLPALLAETNKGVSVSMMIESVEGLANIEAIASVPGVDYLSFGMMDLAQSLGHAGNPGHPEVKAAVAKASDIIRKAGKLVREDFSSFIWFNDLVADGGQRFLSK